MEIRELRAFVTLAEELNFRKASERLGMSQPPLTRLISQLELSLGVALFKRTTRSVDLTGEGIHLLGKAKKIIDEVEQVEKEVRSLNRLKSGQINLSMSMTSLHSTVPKLINTFRTQFPRIKINIVDHSVASLERDLKTGKLDIAFGVNELESKDIEQFSVHSHELGVLVSLESPLARKKEIQLKDLEGQTLILHGKHEKLNFQGEFLAYLTRKNIKTLQYYKKNKESCPSLVAQGKGVLITAHNMVTLNSFAKFIPFSGFKAKLKIYGCWSGTNNSLPLEAFLNFLRENVSVPHSHSDHLG